MSMAALMHKIRSPARPILYTNVYQLYYCIPYGIRTLKTENCIKINYNVLPWFFTLACLFNQITQQIQNS